MFTPFLIMPVLALHIESQIRLILNITTRYVWIRRSDSNGFCENVFSKFFRSLSAKTRWWNGPKKDQSWMQTHCNKPESYSNHKLSHFFQGQIRLRSPAEKDAQMRKEWSWESNNGPSIPEPMLGCCSPALSSSPLSPSGFPGQWDDMLKVGLHLASYLNRAATSREHGSLPDCRLIRELLGWPSVPVGG